MDPNEWYTPELYNIIQKAYRADGQITVNRMREYIEEDTETLPLSQLSRDLTQEARDNDLDPVIGRDGEIRDIIGIIGCKRKNNPVLIGEAGVGKTAIVEGLAQRIVYDKVPKILQGKKVIALDLAMLVGGTRYRGQLERRVKTILAEIESKKEQIVLFIDEIHTIVGAGSARGTLDISNMLKPALARGDLRCIGATTFDEYRKYIEKDAALERRFQPVTIKEPSIDDTIRILKGLKETYEDYHRVNISENAIYNAVKLSERYISNRFLPDKAVEIFDRAASEVKVAGDPSAKKSVKSEDIAEIVERLTNIPISRLLKDETEKLQNMEKHLGEMVIGQDEAVSAVSNAIRRARVGLGNPDKPAGSFLSMGPTGVGKTHLAKSLADFLFDDANCMVRIDMSEYKEKNTISRLIGAPPGYIGHDEGGQLTEAVRRHPYCVILLDEITEANSEVFNVLLQTLDDGRMTDGHGRTVNFKNTIIIMTSNIGSEWINKPHLNTIDIHQHVMKAVQTSFRPEFLNRIDEMIIFKMLDIEELKQIVTLEFDQLSIRFTEKGITLTLSDAAKDELVSIGFDPAYGARPLQRTFNSVILNPLAVKILEGKYKKGDSVCVTFKKGEFSFQTCDE